MKQSNSITIFCVLALVTFLTSGESAKFPGEQNSRRILHQPFLPAVSSSAPPPPPPSPPLDSSAQDQPFFHELPTGPVLDQGQQPPPPPLGGGEPPVLSNPAKGPPASSAKKVAIAAASVVLTLTTVAVMAFYLYKHRGSQTDEARKLVAGNSMAGESRMPPPPPPASAFLYIGTVEPSNGTSGNDASSANRSPYRKLNSGKRSDRYRPSPELQPLPPLPPLPPKPAPPPRQNSPPPMSSSDDDNNFYTPQGSSESPVSRQNRVPHSKRTSPKSRLSLSSPDTKPVIIPSIKQSLPPSPRTPTPQAAAAAAAHSKTLPYIPKSAGLKFSAPPPPPDITRLRSISGDDHHHQTSSVPIPPPPPPISKKHRNAEAYTPPPVPKKLTTPESKSFSPKTNPGTENSSIDEEDNDGSKLKLKPLHWDKVRATSDRATVWDQLKSSSFQLNEDAIESLFGCNTSNSVGKEVTGRSFLPIREQENRVLDPKKSQNIAILLRALNVTVEEVSEALLHGNPEGLGLDLLETLVKMAPTKEEEIKLKDYNGEVSKLGSAERFLKVILDIPFAFKRVESMLYRANFDNEIVYLRKSFQTLEEASEELKNSRLFLKLLEAVLRTGNRLNDGTNRGDAMAFKLDTLLKLVDVKGADGRTTLLHFVVQEIIRSEGAESDPTNRPDNFKLQELRVVSGLSKELANVRKAAGMDSDVLSGYVNKLEMGLEKIRSVMQLEKQMTQRGEFFDSMKEFLNEADGEINRIKAEERKALSLVKEVTGYFHGSATKEEAHPFRIFVIVRDFLSVLDSVCRDVGRMQDRATVGAGRSFRMQTTSSLPVYNRYNVYHNEIFNNEIM